ncbi:L-histidine N(alpha)-methyltransferase [Chitinibacteraceae bacterium HSL-7]
MDLPPFTRSTPPRIINALRSDARRQDAALTELTMGLMGQTASISPKYLYDAVGCALYDTIVRTDAYYPTRSEARLFERHRADIAAAIGPGRQWVDLGSGDSAKAEAWFDFAHPARYVAVDIAEAAVVPALGRLAASRRVPQLCGLITDFAGGLEAVDALEAMPTTFFYPGSSLGNFDRADAIRLLASLATAAPEAGSTLLIGLDGTTAPERLQRAYDDEAGVTAAFNRNLLLHVNRLLGSDFDPRHWVHRVAVHDNRVAMWLDALAPQTVTWPGGSRTFRANEGIHTENAHKYPPTMARALLEEAGWHVRHEWLSDDSGFAVYLAECGDSART